MQDLPHLNNLYTTGIRKGTLHCTIITAGLKKWKVNRPLGDWTPDLALHNWDYKLTIFTFYCAKITLAQEPRFRGEDPKSSQYLVLRAHMQFICPYAYKQHRMIKWLLKRIARDKKVLAILVATTKCSNLLCPTMQGNCQIISTAHQGSSNNEHSQHLVFLNFITTR